MIEKTSISFSNPLTADQITPQGLAAILHDKEDVVRDLLTGYHFGEAGRVEHVRCLEDSIKGTEGYQGTLVVAYETHYVMGCSGNSFNKSHVMLLRWAVKGDGLELIGEEVVERVDEL